ncbi:MAG: hypothetical protein EP297_07280 [Gammaproteobacteria bacterium]|nr:MAG: hypothetical protein EP297_07280 [Gammaproteobacteria bacterium]
MHGGLGNLGALDYANVRVPDEDVERARSLIAEYEYA